MTAAFTPKPSTCGTCRFWSQWLPTTGDCMAYAYKRREAMMTWDAEKNGPFAETWPQKSASMTAEYETCGEYERREAKP